MPMSPAFIDDPRLTTLAEAIQDNIELLRVLRKSVDLFHVEFKQL